MVSITDWLSNFSPKDLLIDLLNGNYYDFVFPFLLVYALFYTVLGSKKVSLFRHGTILNKASVFVVSVSMSLFAVYYPLPSGYTIGVLMGLMFPNISSITIVILGLYVVGAMIGKDFFRGAFDKKTSAFGALTVAGIALGLVIFYVGLAFGAWDYNPFDGSGIISVIIAVIFMILAIVFLIIHMAGYAFILFIVTLNFIVDGGDTFILNYFIDPITFVIIVFTLMLTWVNSDGEEKKILQRDLNEQNETLEGYKERNNGKLLPDYDSRLQDISSSGFESNKKKWEKKHPGESWEK
ncbi:MAG: hypothetical protein HRU03_05575 [Nanoarchaeales archaeon]|nr:hypothetical protein [Nanoarchaeales archaeon]